MKSLPVELRRKTKRTSSVEGGSGKVAEISTISKSLGKDLRLATKKVTYSYVKRVKRYVKQGIKSTLLSPVFHSLFKVAVVAVILTGSLYYTYRVIGRTFANEVVVSQSEIIARVAKLTTVPHYEPYEIVRVQDAEALKKQNVFYSELEEGDYILMYKDLAVIYDLRRDRIVAVKRNEVVVPKF